MARKSWSGAITFAGFPIHVATYKLAASSPKSFKQLAPTDGLPIRQALMDTSGTEVDRASCGRGYEVQKGKIVPLSPEAIEMIQGAERTDVLDPECFAPANSVPLDRSSGHYRVVPDEKIPGSDGPFKILWNGLRATERALVTKWVPRSGAKDELVAFVATDEGIEAHTIPFAADLRTDAPTWTPEVDDQAAEVFEQVVDANYDTTDFDHEAFESDYQARRDEAIAAALDGKVVVAPEKAKATAAVPDLMAAMQASLGAKKGPAVKGAKKPAKAKPKAKVEA